MKSLQGMKILVVDDELLIREILEELLVGQGAIVETAENGRVALGKLKAAHFDILFSDVRMPGGDGVELVRQIPPDQKSKLKIYLCSGYNDLKVEDAKKMGVLHVFAKPFQFQDIVKVILKGP